MARFFNVTHDLVYFKKILLIILACNSIDVHIFDTIFYDILGPIAGITSRLD